MSIYHLPIELLRKHLLPYLSNHDLLRLRRATLHHVDEAENEAIDGEDPGAVDKAVEEVKPEAVGAAKPEAVGAAKQETVDEIKPEAVVDVADPRADDETDDGADDEAEDTQAERRRLLQENVQDFLQTKAICNKTYYIGEVPDLVDLDGEEGTWNHIRYLDMEAFLELNLPMHPHRFHFDFERNEDVFNDEQWMMTDFLELHANHLTHLTISHLTLPLEDVNAYEFFTDHATSIEFLSIGTLHFNFFEEGEEREIPPFQNLKTLKIFNLALAGDTELQNLQYFWEVVGSCTKLETLSLPNNVADDQDSNDENYLALGYHHLESLLNEDLLQNLKYYNMENCWWMEADNAGENTFFHFCESMGKHGILLQNVHCSFFEAIVNPEQLETIGSVIYSMREYNLSLGSMQFPKMENIVIETESSSGGDRFPEEEFPDPEWPSLKYLQLIVNSDWLEDDFDTDLLYEVLFERRVRPSVETLDISGNKDDCGLILPMFEDIATACPNVTCLTIQHWVAGEVDYADLWRALKHLQSVTLHDCRSIGLGAFTGDNVQEPVFLQLKNLKKLRLIKVHFMTNITDDVFKQIFQHVPLQEFILDSYDGDLVDTQTEITSFSRDGIESLLNGVFANTIEIFPFECFELQGVSRQQMIFLEQCFRSGHMK